MQTLPVRAKKLAQAPPTQGRPNPKGDFSEVLSRQVTGQGDIDQIATKDAQKIVHVTSEGNRKQPIVAIGSISKKNPTVSHLLVKHPIYKSDTWRIIHSKVNQEKSFSRLQAGMKIYLNPETFELVWEEDNSLPDPRPAVASPEKPSRQDLQAKTVRTDPFSEGLLRAVEPYMGSPYEKMNCYELVVRGLQKMGVRYQGRGGLGQSLIRMAVGSGLPKYAYLNGEGLIKASGSQVYSRTLSRIHKPEATAEKVYEEIEPLLSRGFILSFSTPTRGHTGIVARRNRLWTYINSGNMDHHIGAVAEAKGVGEELLMGELRNWVKLAQERKEPLLITLGRLNEKKLRSFLI